MRYATVSIVVLLAGCAPYTRVQIDLAAQARKGVALWEQSQDQHAALVGQLEALQRQRLDEAFDADVRGRADLEADWVIEHRRAYAAALDALHGRAQGWRDTDAAIRDNIRATDEALQRLLWLQALELKLFTPSQQGESR